LINPKILVFDDSLSAVDVETEYLIQQALRRAMTGRTTLIVTHRLSSIRDADKIIYLDNGQLVEMGSHAELIKHEGNYSRLYNTLFREQSKHLEELDAYTREREMVTIPPSLELLAAAEKPDEATKMEREKSREQPKHNKEVQKRAQRLEEAKRRLELMKQKEEDKKQKEEEKEQVTLLRREAKKKEDIERWFERDAKSEQQGSQETQEQRLNSSSDETSDELKENMGSSIEKTSRSDETKKLRVSQKKKGGDPQ